MTAADAVCRPELNLLDKMVAGETRIDSTDAIDNYMVQLNVIRQSSKIQRESAEKILGIDSDYDVPNAVNLLSKLQVELAKPEAERQPVTIYHNNLLKMSANGRNPGFIKPENSGLLLGLVGAGEPEVQDEGIRKTETCQTVIPGVTFVREQQGIGQNNPQDFTQFRFTKQS